MRLGSAADADRSHSAHNHRPSHVVICRRKEDEIVTLLRPTEMRVQHLCSLHEHGDKDDLYVVQEGPVIG